jgi:hypothetical protein
VEIDSPDTMISSARIAQLKHASARTRPQRNLPPSTAATLNLRLVESNAHGRRPLYATDPLYLPLYPCPSRILVLFLPSFSLIIIILTLIVLTFFLFFFHLLFLFLLFGPFIFIVGVFGTEKAHVRDAQSALGRCQPQRPATHAVARIESEPAVRRCYGERYGA